MWKNKTTTKGLINSGDYSGLLSSVSELLQEARRSSARAVNIVLTATYWEIGRRIVDFEQAGKVKAKYGQIVLKKLAVDLTSRFGKGFGWRNLFQMRSFYLSFSQPVQTTAAVGAGEGGKRILQTLSAISETPSRKLAFADLVQAFPLSWSHYVRLLSVGSRDARAFYEYEAVRGGWSVRQLDRQIATQFYERTALSKRKVAMLTKGSKPQPGDKLTPEEEIKDPYVLEFLGLKDEYSESQLEEALIYHLERFLLELGGGFAFVGRQKRLRIGSEWYRVDLLFFHRRLRCLVVIDLKVGKFTHADAGQMHLYLNYARAHWVDDGENPPVGLILCAEKDSAVAKYALEGLPNKVLAAEYRLALPAERSLARELDATKRKLIRRKTL